MLFILIFKPADHKEYKDSTIEPKTERTFSGNENDEKIYEQNRPVCSPFIIRKLSSSSNITKSENKPENLQMSKI